MSTRRRCCAIETSWRFTSDAACLRQTVPRKTLTMNRVGRSSDAARRNHQGLSKFATLPSHSGLLRMGTPALRGSGNTPSRCGRERGIAQTVCLPCRGSVIRRRRSILVTQPTASRRNGRLPTCATVDLCYGKRARLTALSPGPAPGWDICRSRRGRWAAARRAR